MIESGGRAESEPLALSQALDFLKWSLPKKPRRAERGEGCCEAGLASLQLFTKKGTHGTREDQMLRLRTISTSQASHEAQKRTLSSFSTLFSAHFPQARKTTPFPLSPTPSEPPN